MDQEKAAELAQASWPEMSADLTLARTQARSIMLDTQRANSDGRILELDAQIELMRTRMAAFEQQLVDSEGDIPEDIAERLDTIDSALDAAQVRFENFSTRISSAEETASTTMLSNTTTIEERIEAIEAARLTQSNELKELSGFLEDSLTRIADLSSVVETERKENESERKRNKAERKTNASERERNDAQQQLNVAEREQTATDREQNAELHETQTIRLDTYVSRLSNVEQSVGDLNIRLGEALESINASSAVQSNVEQSIETHHNRLASAESQTVSNAERVESILEQIAQQSATQDEIATTIQFLQTRAAAIEDTHDTKSNEFVEHVNVAHGRLDDHVAELSALKASIELTDGRAATAEALAKVEARVRANEADQHATLETIDQVTEAYDHRLADHQTKIESHTRTIDAAAALLTQHNAVTETNSGAIAEFAKKADEHDAAVEGLLRSVTTVNELARQATNRVEETHQQLEALTERSAETGGRLDSLAERVEAEAGTQSRIDALEPAIEQNSARIESVHSRLSELDSRTVAADEHAASASENSDEIADRTSSLEDRATALEDQHNKTETRLTELAALPTTPPEVEPTDLAPLTADVNALTTRVDTHDQRHNDTTERTTALETETAQLHKRLDKTKKSLGEMSEQLTAALSQHGTSDAELAQQVQALATSTRELQARAADPYQGADVGALTAQVSAAEHAVQDTQQSVQGWIKTLEKSSAEANDELRDFMIYRIDTAEDRIDRRLSDVEANGAGNERLEAMEQAIAEADRRAQDAQAFSENLRLLQTDIVEALQADLATQAKRIAQLEAKFSTSI